MSWLQEKNLSEPSTPPAYASEENDQYWRRVVAKSNGQSRAAETRLNIRGLSSKDFLTWLAAAGRDEAKMQAAHPEHYHVASTFARG
ncbi:hypothetical protein N657DRAFT_683369 [Parathielavia appendiculata]|uniref:Uncharacterized protein n=1 Tax=Parathielavia appendiculata TaxID=2587402 RepID=A0AAN6Z0W1_9PEZI|nr:hypothetical protein N657DRAFT_683369 [Parathielavia appendiculata]